MLPRVARVMSIPTREQINPYDDLDGRAACDHFLGKSLEQAEALFRENGDYYGGDLMWMGPVAFRYYVQAAIRVVKNESEPRRLEIIPAFVLALEHRLEFERAELVPIAAKLAEVCSYILEHYDVLGDLPGSEEQTRKLQDTVRRELKKLEQVLGKECLEKDCVDLRPRLKKLVEALSRLHFP
jgi:hypothetical protein